MNDLFKKLNVLVKASLNDLLGDESQRPNRPVLPFDKLGKNIDQEVANLRERINDALNYEDELTARVQTLETEVANWDEQADAAVSSGQEENGRYAIAQMQLTQQRLSMAEADLRDHQRVTQELILRVNELEAAVADARRAQEVEAADASAAVEAAPTEPAPDAQALDQRVNRMASDVLRDMREKVTEMSDLINTRSEIQAADNQTEALPTDLDDRQIEDDLTRRRNRLSKK